jgi:hypothetical protein
MNRSLLGLFVANPSVPSSIARALLGLLMLASPLSSHAQQRAEPTDPLSQWLWLTCEVGEEGSAAAKLAALGTTVISSLVAAANAGPSAQVIADRQQDLIVDYQAEQAYLSAGGTPGSDPGDNAMLQGQTQEAFVAEDITRFTANYRVRAVQGLGVVGGPQAIQALQTLATSPIPEVSQAAKDSLLLIAPSFSVPDVAGLSQAAASTKLNAAGLAVGTVTTQTSATVIVGLVISEMPPAGTLVLAKSAVNLVVSSGRLLGDLNADGVVNCADLAIIKMAFGKKVGQAGFDIRADVNGDGVVNIFDLSAEARLVPAGTVCN